MKKYTFLLVSMVILASCSSPKYTYYFDHYDYNSGKKKATTQEGLVSQEQPEAKSMPEVNSTVVVDEKTLVASTKENEVYIANPTTVMSKEEAIERLKSMSKEEKKELKREVKKYVKEKKRDVNSAKAMENDVKLAAIFGVIGIVLLIIGGDVLYILGAVALIIGLYFFIRWLVRQ